MADTATAGGVTDRPTVWPGDHRELGARADGGGTNFAVWAPDASVVDVCLFDDAGVEVRLPLPEHTLGVWHGYVPGVGAGQRYGFRAVKLGIVPVHLCQSEDFSRQVRECLIGAFGMDPKWSR